MWLVSYKFVLIFQLFNKWFLFYLDLDEELDEDPKGKSDPKSKKLLSIRQPVTG